MSRTTLISVDPVDGSTTTWWTSTQFLLASVGSDGRVVVADADVTSPVTSDRIDVLPRAGIGDLGA